MEKSFRNLVVPNETKPTEKFTWGIHSDLGDQKIDKHHILNAWYKSFLPGKSWKGPLKFFVCFRNKEIIGFIPFARQKLSLLSIDSLAGYYWPFRTIHIGDIQYSIEENAIQVGKLLANHPVGNVLRFGPISGQDRGLLTVLRTLDKSGWYSLSKDNGSVFALDLPENISSLREVMSSSLLKNVEYCLRRLNKNNTPVSVERHVMTESLTIFDKLEKIELNSWLAKKDSELKFVGSENRNFWLNLNRHKSSDLQSVFWILECNGEPIAFSAHLESNDTIYIIANSFDELWKNHSPGSILTFEVLKDAISRGIKKVDWGQGDSGYKQRWGAYPSSSIIDVMLFRPNLIGKIFAKLAKRALPSWQRGILG